jgi:tripartite-type tricarboxylate transporter receptor subunit TctC
MKRTILVILCVLMSLPLFAGGAKESAAAVNFPTGPITMIVPYATGGTGDIAGRMVAQYLGEILGQKINVVNKGGAGGVLGATELASAKPDGYTIGNMMPSDLYMASAAGTFDINSIDFVAQYMVNPFALFLKPGSPFKNIKELVDYAKANPGRLAMAESGKAHIVGLGMFGKLAGINIKTVSFASGGESQSALLGGHVDIASLTPSYIKNVEGGGGRLLGVYGDSKLEAFPDLPYFLDYGYPVPNAVGSICVLSLPNKVDPAIRKVWTDAIEKLIKNQGFLKALADAKYPFAYLAGDALKKSIKDNNAMVGQIAKELKLVN